MFENIFENLIGGRRRKKKAKDKNLYTVLGTKSNISQEKIKGKYIEKVKEFPPEQYPEEFQLIRRAYDTLSDPLKRSDYDLVHKYGGKIEKKMDLAVGLLYHGEIDRALKLTQEILEAVPNSIPVCLFRAEIALLKNDEITFQEKFAHVERLAPRNRQERLFLKKAHMLYEEDYYEQALTVLKNKHQLSPENEEEYNCLLFDVYERLDKGDERWELVQTMIPTLESQLPEDIYIFIRWINAMVDTQRWNEKSKIKTRVKKFLKSISDEDDRWMVLVGLDKECTAYLEVRRYREVELYTEFIRIFDNGEMIKQRLNYARKMVNFTKEFNKIGRDEEIFPLVILRVYELYYEENFPEQDISYLRDGIPKEVLADYEEMAEKEYPKGLRKLKRKYPLIYEAFQEELEEDI